MRTYIGELVNYTYMVRICDFNIDVLLVASL